MQVFQKMPFNRYTVVPGYFTRVLEPLGYDENWLPLLSLGHYLFLPCRDESVWLRAGTALQTLTITELSAMELSYPAHVWFGSAALVTATAQIMVLSP